MNKNLILIVLTAAVVSVLNAAVVTTSTTPPFVGGYSESNLVPATGNPLKWYSGVEHDAGQTFTPSAETLFKSFTIHLNGSNPNDGADEWVLVRLGTITRPGDVFTFTDFYSEEAHWDMDWFADDYVTFTFDVPQVLNAGVEYGIILDAQAMGAWQQGIPYIKTAPGYPGGHAIARGAPVQSNVGDMVFHANLVDPLQPSPVTGSIVAAGDVDLGWTNIDPNDGFPVYVDVWYGTDPLTPGPGTWEKVLSLGQDANSITVSAPVADTYYWQVELYFGGNTSTPAYTGTVFEFTVIDTDADGLPDEYELLYTDPPSGTAMDPNEDLEPDGLVNLAEYNLGTIPDNPDTDGDTLLDGPELSGVDLRPPTDPLSADTDNDSLSDGVETNTGVWVDASDTGTNPADPDTDKDGLTDGVETNTGVFIDASNTGTNPHSDNSDGDNALDWYEVAASYTSPVDAGDQPVIPYPLPDPDGSAGATDKPVKVYIMSGQSNMVGYGTVSGTGPGRLEYMCNTENKFPNLVDEAGDWLARGDVYYRGVVSDIGDGPLAANVAGSTYGPELGFGQVMGYAHDEPVLLIKASIGNRSLSWDYAPPSTPQFDYNGNTYAGYGDTPNSWPTGTTPPAPGEPGGVNWYAGYEFNRMFFDEADFHPTSSLVGLTSAFNVVDILDDFATEYPQFAAQGFEIAGFVWWQGHKDGGQQGTGTANIHATRYEFNMTNFINDIRAYYEGRYPGKISPKAPFVVATVGFDAGDWEPGSSADVIHAAQLAVGDGVSHPEFNGNVGSVDTVGYWRDASVSPTGTGYHYNHNAETYLLVGDALGRAMLELEGSGQVYAGDDMVTWSGEGVPLAPQFDPAFTPTSFAWTAFPADGVVFTPSASVEAPVVTITKATSNPSPVTVTLTASDASDSFSSSLIVDVYDTPCDAAIGKGLKSNYPTDIAGDDCKVNLEDVAAIAAEWLESNALQAPQPK